MMFMLLIMIMLIIMVMFLLSMMIILLKHIVHSIMNYAEDYAYAHFFFLQFVIQTPEVLQNAVRGVRNYTLRNYVQHRTFANMVLRFRN